MPTHFPGDDTQRRALDVYIKLLRASNALATGAWEATPSMGLTPTQFGVLESLLHLGPLKPKQIAQKHLKSPNNITTVLEALERDGLVRREADPKDGRSVTIHLTCEGKRQIAEAFPTHVAAVVNLVGVLDAEEQETLAKLLRKLGRQETENSCCPMSECERI